MATWYARPVFFRADIRAALAFYVESLGFDQAWASDEDGRTVPRQVQRGDCEVILNWTPTARELRACSFRSDGNELLFPLVVT